jgi:hypothetical protein
VPNLNALMQQLKAEGPSGLEGLVATLLSEALGLPSTLPVPSGSQDGRDVGLFGLDGLRVPIGLPSTPAPKVPLWNANGLGIWNSNLTLPLSSHACFPERRIKRVRPSYSEACTIRIHCYISKISFHRSAQPLRVRL